MASPRGTEDHFTDKESVRCSTLFGFLRLDIVFEIICRNADHSGNNFTRNSRNTVIFSFFLLHIAKQQLAKTKKYFSSIEDVEVLNLECFAFFLGAYSAL